MQKILVIGSGGAGKTTFAKRLSSILGIEVVHLDALYWNPGWVETPKAEWNRTIESLIERDSWIMDGNYSGTLDLRTKACDTVIFLDMATCICLYRVIKRALKYRNRNRPDMGAGCLEKLDMTFILWIWNYRKRTRPKIIKLIQENCSGKRVIWLQSNADVERFIAEVRRINRAENSGGS
jgi:adenylate kinase family enzyme